MANLEELKKACENIDENKRVFIYSMLKDFVFLDNAIDELRKYPRFAIKPDDFRIQKKLPVHDMLKDYQAQKNDIATKILKALEEQQGGESPLAKLLKEFNEE